MGTQHLAFFRLKTNNNHKTKKNCFGLKHGELVRNVYMATNQMNENMQRWWNELEKKPQKKKNYGSQHFGPAVGIPYLTMKPLNKQK